jgi:hypothetical protein
MGSRGWNIDDFFLDTADKNFEDVLRSDDIIHILLSDDDSSMMVDTRGGSRSKRSIFSSPKPKEKKKELKQLLKNIPFVIPFEVRVMLFRKFIAYDRSDY